MVRLLHAARTDVGMIRSGNEDNYAVNANGDHLFNTPLRMKSVLI